MSLMQITDLPLVCDNLIVRHLRQNNVTAIVLSDRLLTLWRLGPLTDRSSTIDVKQLASDWRPISSRDDDGRYGDNVDDDNDDDHDDANGCRTIKRVRVSKNVIAAPAAATAALIKIPRYLISVRVIDGIPTAKASGNTIHILPRNRLDTFIRTNPADCVLLVDQWDLFTGTTIRKIPPNWMFAFTFAPDDDDNKEDIDVCHAIVAITSNAAAGPPFPSSSSSSVSRTTFTAWQRYIANEALLPHDHHLLRFRLVIDDPTDTLFWRNLIAVLTRRTDIATAASSAANVIVELTGVRDHDYMLELRVKRFLAFFVQTNDILRGRNVNLYWRVRDNKRRLVHRLLARICEHAAVAHALKMENFSCYVTPSIPEKATTPTSSVASASAAAAAAAIVLPKFQVLGCCDHERGDGHATRHGYAVSRDNNTTTAAATHWLRDQSDGLPRLVMINAFKRRTRNCNTAFAHDGLLDDEERRRRPNAIVLRSDDLNNATPIRNVFVDVRSDSVMGLRKNGSLLLKNEALVYPRVSNGYLLPDGVSIVQRHFSGAPIFKFARPRFA